jgi:hypothetical protein
MTNYYGTLIIVICAIFGVTMQNLGRNGWKYLNSILFNTMINLYKSGWPFYTKKAKINRAGLIAK